MGWGGVGWGGVGGVSCLMRSAQRVMRTRLWVGTGSRTAAGDGIEVVTMRRMGEEKRAIQDRNDGECMASGKK